MSKTEAPRLVRRFGFRDDEFLPYSVWEPGEAWDPRDEGLVAELISAKLSASRDLNVGVGRMLGGQYHIKHHHPRGSEFYFFLSGSARVHVDGEEVTATRGTVIYLPPGCVHSIRNTGEEPVDLVYGLSKPEYSQIGLVYDE